VNENVVKPRTEHPEEQVIILISGQAFVEPAHCIECHSTYERGRWKDEHIVTKADGQGSLGVLQRMANDLRNDAEELLVHHPASLVDFVKIGVDPAERNSPVAPGWSHKLLQAMPIPIVILILTNKATTALADRAKP
jgi:hypothetical protein